MVIPCFAVGSAANLESARLLHEDYESGAAILYPTKISETMLIEDGDDTNDTKYANHISPTGSQWKTMDTWAKGVVVYELRAKYNGTYNFGFGKIVTRDGGGGETWSRTAEIRISDTSWKYYRIFVDYASKSVTAFSSYDGFEDLEQTELTFSFGRDSGGNYAEGMKVFTVNNLAFDDFSIYENPNSGDWISDVSDGAEDISVNPQIKISYFSSLDETSISGDNIVFESENGETAEAIYECKKTGLTITPREALMNDTEYTLKVNGAKNTDGSDMEDVALRFGTVPYSAAEVLKLNSAAFSTADGEYTDVDSVSGDVKYKFNITNLTQNDVNFTVIMALYRNFGGKVDYMESYKQSEFSISAEGTSDFETEAINIAEHLNGEYAVRVFFVETDTYHPCLDAICYGTAENKQSMEGNTALLDITASEYDAQSGAFEISAGKKAAPGRRVTFVLLSEQRDILYIGQETLTQQYGFSKKFHLPENFQAGTYTLIAKCEDELPVTKMLQADPSGSVPVCYYGKIDGEVSEGNTISAKYSVYSAQGDVSAVWECADAEDGSYTEFAQGDSVDITSAQSNKYIRFSLIHGGRQIYNSESVKVSATEKPDKVRVFLETNFDDNDNYWTSLERINSDGVNKSKFVRTAAGSTAGFVTITNEANGTVILQFRAKSLGQGYFTVSTRQDSNYQKTINYTNKNVSQINSWGYYRVVLDCENASSKVYYSPNSFMEMTQTAGNAVFSNATGFNMLTFQNCCIDDIRVLSQPNPGAFTYDITDGAEVVFYSPMDSTKFTESNISLYTADDKKNVTGLSNIGQFGFKAVPMLDVIYDRSYRLVMNENLTTEDGTALASKSFDFGIGEEPAYNLLRLTDEKLTNNGTDADKVIKGENRAEFKLTNISGSDINAVITFALYKNTNGADYMVDYVQTNETIPASASMKTVSTGILNVPEGNDGDYALRVFVGRDQNPYDTVAKVCEFGTKTGESDKNDNTYARKYKVSLDNPSVDYSGGVINIKGNVHSGKNKRVVILIKDNTDNVVYIGYTQSVYENGSFSVNTVIPPDITDSKYAAEAYAEKVSQKAVAEFFVETSKIKPVALNVRINGNCAALEAVSAEYSYYHPLGTQMAGVEYAWYIADSENGSFQKVGNENTYEIKEDESAKYLKCSVKVSDGEAESAEMFSSAARIIAKPIASKLEIQGTKRAGSRAYAAYEYFHADNIPQENSQIEWYISTAEDGTYESIGTGDYVELTEAMAGKYIKFSVIPGSSTGNGSKKTSSPFLVLNKESSGGGGSGSYTPKNNVGQTSISTDVKPEDKTNTAKEEFSDMQGHWAKSIVDTLRNKGIINGKSENEFAPDEGICRGDFSLLLARVGSLKAEKSYDFKDVDKSSYYYEAIAALYENKIIQGYDGYIRPSEPVSREEVAAITVRYIDVLGLGFTRDSAVEFADGDSISAWAAESVDSAARMGIMIGDNASRFNPKNTLTRAESAAIILRLTENNSATEKKYVTGSALSEKLNIVKTDGLFSNGYASKDDFKNIISQIGGEYHDGGEDGITLIEAATCALELLGYGPLANVTGMYMKYADRIELLKDMGKVNQSENLTPVQLMKLVDNILLARVYDMKAVDNDKIVYDQDDTYLYKQFSIRKNEGVLNATDKSSMQGSFCLDKDFIEIDTEKYKTKFNCSTLLGYKVAAYYDCDNEIILYVEAISNKNRLMKIDARDVDYITKNTIVYIPKGTTGSRKENISDYMPVLVNGTFRGYLNTVDTESITPERGSLTLIDNDNDGTYDCLSIVKYDLYVVDSVNKAKHFITFKNKSAGLQFSNDDADIACTVRMNDEEMEFEEIKEWDVLAVLYSDNTDGNKYYEINVIRRTLTGEFSGITDDSIFIDGKEYDLTTEFSRKQIMTGKEYTFLFAGEDDIIWYKDADSYRYGYLYKAGKNDMKKQYLIKLVNDKGEAETIEFAKRVKYNDKWSNSDSVYAELVDEDNAAKQQMIKYCLNDDSTLRSLYTVQTVYSDADIPDKDIFFSKTEKASRYEHINTYGFLYSMASGSTTFFINGNDEVLSEDNISVGKMSGTSDSSYMCEFFDVDNIGQAKAAIFYRENSSISDTVPQACFVDKVNYGTDENGNSGMFLSYYYYFDGTYKREFIEEDKKVSNAGFYQYFSDEAISSMKDLERGDIVQLSKNNEGSITSFRVLYDRSAVYEYGTIIRSTNDNAPRIEVIYSPVYNIDGSKIKVKGKDGNMRVYDIAESGSKYFKAYLLNPEEKTLALTDYSNILSVEDTGSEEQASKVVLIAQSGYVRCIMIEDGI